MLRQVMVQVTINTYSITIFDTTVRLQYMEQASNCTTSEHGKQYHPIQAVYT